MAEPLEVAVNLTNQKVQFTGISKSNPDRPVSFDYYPPLGDGQGFTGLEMLLMSFAGCSATSVVYLLRKMGKTISGFTANAKGIRRDTHPTSFLKIFLEFTVTSADAEDGSMKKAIQLSEETVCPVWAMIKNNCEVVTDYKIIRP